MTESEFKEKTKAICHLFERCKNGCPLGGLFICLDYHDRDEVDFMLIKSAYHQLFGWGEAEITMSADDVMRVLSAE